MAKAEDGDPIRTKSGDMWNEPSEDELVPYVSKEDLAANSTFLVLGPD